MIQSGTSGLQEACCAILVCRREKLEGEEEHVEWLWECPQA